LTLVWWAKGVLPHKGAAISQQLLTPSEESTLVDWCAHFALTAKPLNYHGVWAPQCVLTWMMGEIIIAKISAVGQGPPD